LLGKLAALNLALPITVVMDNARYQRCQLVQTLARQLNIELLFLPSYSPNLNLIERLWKFVKKTALNSRPHGCVFSVALKNLRSSRNAALAEP
jgi:transposase